MTPNEWGDFLAGTVGPVALIWVVLGFILQGRELQHSVEALRLQAQELKNSVEQQKAMVGITEKQLNLDIEVRKDQLAAALTRDLPLFQLRAGGSSSEDQGRRYSFFLKNIGAASSYFEIQFSGLDKEKYRLSGNYGPSFVETGQETEFGLIGPHLTPDQFDGLVFDLHSRNIRDQSRNQTFGYKDGKIILFHTEPAIS